MKKFLIFTLLACAALASLFAYQYFAFHDGKLHIVWCDVGQGDGILVTTPTDMHIMIDAGPDGKILDCLSRHMGFWERKIDLALLTHPHADHFSGYYYLVDRYTLNQFSTEDLINKTVGFAGLKQTLANHKISEKIVHTGDRWRVGEVLLTIEGPTKEFEFRKNPDGVITNSAESASLVTLVTYGSFRALLTGDAPVDEMEEILDEGMTHVDVTQIPHHGSSTGVDERILDVLSPHLAVISVGAHNRYGHPKQSTLDLLQQKGIHYLRTDQVGDVEIVSDGKAWRVL